MGESSDRERSEERDNEVSRRLREAREEAGISLRELARRMDISASALSQIETGKSRPSVRTLYSLVSELELSMDDLFENPGKKPNGDTAITHPAGGQVTVTRAVPSPSGDGATSHLQKADSRAVIDLDSGVVWERLTSEHDPFVDFLYVRYEVGGTSNAHRSLVRHNGMEYGIILEGSLDVTVGFETYRLEVGDSISFNSNEPHVLANNGDVPAAGIWFVIGRRQSDPRIPPFEDGEPTD